MFVVVVVMLFVVVVIVKSNPLVIIYMDINLAVDYPTTICWEQCFTFRTMVNLGNFLKDKRTQLWQYI